MQTNKDDTNSNELLEKNTIFPISASLRHGRPIDLFFFWFGTHLQLMVITVGIIDTSSSGYGLPILSAIIAIIIGISLGGFFLALHSAQGTHMGVSQMQQSRAQFGSYGVLPILILVVIMFVGFFASNLAIGVQAISSVTSIKSALTSDLIMLVIAVLSIIVAYYGYDLIHKYAKNIIIFGGITLLIIIAYSSYLLYTGNIELKTTNSFTWAGFVGAIGLSAIGQISSAPLVSDFSRYLPKNTSQKTAFWMTFFGTSIGAFIPMTVGCVIGLTIFSTQDNGFYSFFNVGLGLLGSIFVIFWSISNVEASAAMLYSGSLTSFSIANVFFGKFRPGRKSRFFVITILSIIGTFLAIIANSSFMTVFSNFLSSLLYVLVPWSVINLVDYYLIKDGSYTTESLYSNNGLNSYVNIRASTAYFIGIVIEIPFMSSAVYTGIIAKALGGANISWLVSAPIIAMVYFYLSKSQRSHSHERLSTLIH